VDQCFDDIISEVFGAAGFTRASIPEMFFLPWVFLLCGKAETVPHDTTKSEGIVV